MQNYTSTELVEIIREAKIAAANAANEYFMKTLGGQDRYACGFAWVNVYGVKGNTKLGKAMKAAGFSKSYDGAWQIWNPSNHGAQNVDTKEAGAVAAAEVLKRYGFTAYAGSRLD